MGRGCSDGPAYVHGSVGVVHASTYDLVVVDEYAADGCFVAGESEFRLRGLVSGENSVGLRLECTMARASRMKV